jgi:predicted glutamine amidotransferase
MTRLFGCMVNEPERLRCALYPVRRALVWQRDKTPDGWGLGLYQGGEVLLQKRPRPAPGPVDFYALAKGLRSDCIVAHVRSATVGRQSKTENTHPYRFRSWLFAHHGTFDGFAALRPALMEHIPDFLRRNIRGQTDSEHLMHLFLAFLHDGGKLDDSNLPAAEAADALGATLSLMDRFVVEAGGKPTEHNMIATNGRIMLAARRGLPLHLLRVSRITDCALCRESQADFAREPRPAVHEHLRGVVFVDAGPDLGSPWEAIPDTSTVAVSHDLSFAVRPLGMH